MYIDFAWECIRRNQNYIDDWCIFNAYKQKKILRTSMLKNLKKKWGLIDFINPVEGSSRDVFWCEDKSSRSIRVKLHNKGHLSSDKILSLNNGVSINRLHVKGEGYCLKRYNCLGYSQIFIDEDDFYNISCDKYIYFEIIDGNFDNITRFISNSFQPSNPCVDKMRALLMYDKHIQGLSHKEIADCIYGKKITYNEWETDGWLRARIRYKLKKARMLISEGFENFI
ncbi:MULTISPECIES: transcriptional regulator domain-containing protein [Enterobacter]